MTTIFDQAFQWLADFGFFDVVLPFVLIYAVTYGLLERTGILRGTQEPKKVHQMLAFTISFIAIASGEVVGAVNTLSLYAVMGLLVIVMMLVLFSLLGAKHSDASWALWAVLLAVGVSAGIYFLNILGISRFTNGWDMVLPIVITVVVFYVMIKFITGGEEKPKEVKKPENKPEGKAETKGRLAPGEKAAEFLEEQLKKPGAIWEEK